MPQGRATLLLIAFGLGAVACDTADEFAGCGDPNHPGAPGTDPSNCPQSLFQAENIRARDVSGTIRRGEDPVPATFVSVSQAVGSPGDDAPFTGQALTDSAGFYRIVGSANRLYDLTMILPNGPGGRDDLMIYRGVGVRYVEPHLDVPGRTIGRSWSAHVAVQLATPLPSSDAILFLSNGTGVLGVTGDLTTGLDIHTQTYTATAKLIAIQYNAAQGLTSASNSSEVTVITSAGASQVATLNLQTITDKAALTFAIDAIPPSFTPGLIDIRYTVSGTSDALVASVPYGAPVTVPIVGDVGISYAAHADRADGASSTTGEGFVPDVKVTTHLTFAEPAEIVDPSGTDLHAGDPLTAIGSGVIEHVFEPQSEGNTGVRVLVANRATTLPDATALGVPKMTGTYTYTVRRFPKLDAVESISGAFQPRRSQPSATSAPRAIVLR